MPQAFYLEPRHDSPSAIRDGTAKILAFGDTEAETADFVAGDFVQSESSLMEVLEVETSEPEHPVYRLCNLAGQDVGIESWRIGAGLQRFYLRRDRDTMLRFSSATSRDTITAFSAEGQDDFHRWIATEFWKMAQRVDLSTMRRD